MKYKSYEERLKTLKDNSIWIFTKQETDFEEAFKAAKLFNDIPNIEKTNIEEYFSANHLKYDIKTSRHRILVISQLYGLITKTPYYARGVSYKFERTTEVFKLLEKLPINSREYNVVKTEQILKIKFHAIIDSGNNNENYNIFPVIFMFMILKELKDEHSIYKVDLDIFMTYVMTAESYSDSDEIIRFIVSGGTPYKNISRYKDLSRFLILLRKNVKLFNIDKNYISISRHFESYFNDSFIKVYDINELHNVSKIDIDYAQFLNFYQDFDINLIDINANYNSKIINDKKDLKKSYIISNNEDDIRYFDSVNSINSLNINEKSAIESYLIEPSIVDNNKSSRKYKVNPVLGKIAIKKADFKCEINTGHATFISNRTLESYMEGHHLIPVSYQSEIWNQFNVNIDCVENIVSLCPTCHRAIHYASKSIKENLIKYLFQIREQDLKRIGLNINLNTLIEMYKNI